MMREIGYRIYDPETKTMHYAGIINFSLGHVGIGRYQDLSKVHVMEYTGLKDEKSKKIYEADIIQRSDGALGIVVWDDKEAGFTIHSHSTPGVYKQSEEKVIGNVWENPELLQGESVGKKHKGLPIEPPTSGAMFSLNETAPLYGGTARKYEGESQSIRRDAHGRVIIRLCSCVKCRDFVKLNEFLMLVKEKGLNVVIEQ